MRKLIVQQFGVSLDGFSATEDGEGWKRWGEIDDPELDAHLVENISRVGTHIMGRATYHGHEEHWPRAASSTNPVEREIADLLNNGSKVVFSRSLTEANWPGTRIASGDTSEEIAKLKEEPGNEILAVGGVRFLTSLVRLELFDSIRLFVQPYVAGSGSSIFGELGSPISLRLASSRVFHSGVIELIYDRAD
jgi:dihydrofolate reductase